MSACWHTFAGGKLSADVAVDVGLQWLAAFLFWKHALPVPSVKRTSPGRALDCRTFCLRSEADCGNTSYE